MMCLHFTCLWVQNVYFIVITYKTERAEEEIQEGKRDNIKQAQKWFYQVSFKKKTRMHLSYKEYIAVR